MTLPPPSTFGLPQGAFALGLSFQRMVHRIIKTASQQHWNMAVSEPYGYAELDFLSMFKGKTLVQDPMTNRYIIDGNPAKYYIVEKGGIHLVTPTNETWYRPANTNELTSVLPYFIETTNDFYENHTFFQYIDHRDGAPQEMPGYSLQWHIIQDTDSNGSSEQYNSQKVYRSNNVWNDSLNMRLGVTVQSVNPSTLTNGKPKWQANVVKVRNDKPAKLQLTISTGHDLHVWSYETQIQ